VPLVPVVPPVLVVPVVPPVRGVVLCWPGMLAVPPIPVLGVVLPEAP
jgi:hypothetical protein